MSLKKSVVIVSALAALFASAWGQNVILADDMSEFPIGWTLGSSGLNPDTWTRTTREWYSSSVSVKCSHLASSYLVNTDVWMQRPVSLAGCSLGTMTFWVWQYTERGCDQLNFEFSSDGGLTWRLAWQRSGTYASWHRITIPGIPNSTNAIRFHFHSDSSHVLEVVYVDDVVLYGVNYTTMVTIWSDDMTNFPAGWIRSGRPSWGPQSRYYHSPPVAAQCAGLDSGYENDQHNGIARPVNLQGYSPRGYDYGILSFWLYLQTEGGHDFFEAWYHAPGSWIQLYHNSGYHDWARLCYEIPNNSDSISFYFYSDDTYVLNGAFLDDVTIVGVSAPAIDLAASDIVSPPSPVDYGDTVAVTAIVRNNSSVSAAGPVYFQVSPRYYGMGLTPLIPPGETARVSFLPWEVLCRPGWQRLECLAAYYRDANTANDRTIESTFVRGIDVGALAVTWPEGSIDSGLTIVPCARVKNYGNLPATFKVFIVFDTSGRRGYSPRGYSPRGYSPRGYSPRGYSPRAYSDSTIVSDLPSQAEDTVWFREWPKPHPVRFYESRCSTCIAGDVWPDDNVATGAFYIVALPRDTGWIRKPDLLLGPRSKKVKDGGCLAYSDSSNRSDASCIYAFKGNNTCEFYRYGIEATRREATRREATRRETNVWFTLDSVPAIGRMGKKKCVKNGGSLAEVGGKLYATKGNNTLEFWLYNPSYRSYSSYPWTQKADVPTGAKNVREGAGAVGVTLGDTGYVYLLKGSQTQEFYRYNTIANTWESRAAAPLGVSGKPWKRGSCIAYAPSPQPSPDEGSSGVHELKSSRVQGGLIYALKGSYNEFFAYDCRADAWASLVSLPLRGREGKKKRAKDGAGLAYVGDGGATTRLPAGDKLFALKGGNTLEFWEYDVATNLWVQRTDLPLGSGSGKKVKGGGALVYVPSVNALYALKGNNTPEFWRYGLVAYSSEPSATSSEQPAVSSFSPCASRCLLQIAPNPFANTTTISYSLPKSGNASLKLFDITGKLVTTLARGRARSGDNASRLDASASRLAPGVYLIELESSSGRLTRKVIVCSPPAMVDRHGSFDMIR
jgi:hypothetical protein